MRKSSGQSNQASPTALSANLVMFDEDGAAKCGESSPHLRQRQLQKLYRKLVLRVITAAREYSETPRVLDLGAGEGSATIPFLQAGAYVTAVDVSESQLVLLERRCNPFTDKLDIVNGEIDVIIGRMQHRYDIVVMNSFLHHIPDYLSLIRKTNLVLGPRGQFFSFQDPLRYDTLGTGSLVFSRLGYFSWRIFQGNYIRGLKTRIRRMRGLYIPGSPEDDAEYHVTRNGVDQFAIVDLLKSMSFACELIPYFSAHSSVFQVIGSSLGIENTFGILAQREV